MSNNVRENTINLIRDYVKNAGFTMQSRLQTTQSIVPMAFDIIKTIINYEPTYAEDNRNENLLDIITSDIPRPQSYQQLLDNYNIESLQIDAQLAAAQLETINDPTVLIDTKPAEDEMKTIEEKIEQLGRLDENEGRVDLIRHLMSLFYDLEQVLTNRSESRVIEMLKMNEWDVVIDNKFIEVLELLTQEVLNIACDWAVLLEAKRPNTYSPTGSFERWSAPPTSPGSYSPPPATPPTQ